MSELSFWAELKRRRVYRTAAWYAASIFVIWQVADLVVPALDLPAWTMKALIIVSAIGFFPTLVLSWLYDIKGADSAGRASRMRRALTALVVLLFVVTGWWVGRRVKPAKPALSDVSLAVFPFTVIAPGNLSYLREGLVDLLSRNLTGTTQLQPLDPSLMLKVTQGKPTDAATAGSIARQVGARRFVVGTVSGAGAQLRIDATLYQLGAEPKVLTSKTVEGDTAKLFSLVDQLSGALLAELTTGAATEEITHTAASTTASLPALKAFLQGEHEYRQGNHAAAIAALQSALALDSTFVLAQYRLAMAYQMRAQYWLAHNAIAPVVAQQDRLTPHDRRAVVAFSDFQNGRINQAEREYRAIVNEFPRDLESRVMLATLLNLYNRFKAVSQQEAIDLLESVLEADPRFVCIVCSLGEFYSLAGQFEKAERMFLQSQANRGEDSTKLHPVSALRIALLRHDSAEAHRQLPSFEAFYRDSVAYDEWMLNPGSTAIGAGELGVADQIMALKRFGRGVPQRRESLASMLHTARGQLAQADAEARKALRDARPDEVLDEAYRLASGTPPEFSLSAAQQVRAAIARSAPDTAASPVNELARAERGIRLFMLGLIASRTGDPRARMAYTDSLTVLERDSLSRTMIRNAQLILSADQLMRENKAADALARLDSMSLELRPGQLSSWVQVMDYATLLRVPAYISLQRNDDAYKWLSVVMHYFGLVSPRQAYGIYERDLATVLDRRGQTAESAQHYAAFVAAWANADPSLQRHVAAARTRLSELKAK